MLNLKRLQVSVATHSTCTLSPFECEQLLEDIKKLKAEGIRMLIEDKPNECNSYPLWLHGRSEGMDKNALYSISEFIEKFADEVENG